MLFSLKWHYSFSRKYLSNTQVWITIVYLPLVLYSKKLCDIQKWLVQLSTQSHKCFSRQCTWHFVYFPFCHTDYQKDIPLKDCNLIKLIFTAPSKTLLTKTGFFLFFSCNCIAVMNIMKWLLVQSGATALIYT